MTKDKKKKLVIFVLAIIAIVGICMIAFAWNKDRKSEELQEETLNKYVNSEATETEQENKEWYDQIEVDVEGLQKANQDVVGWIYFENEKSISYPLLYSGDDEKYLRTAYTGDKIDAGSIFVEGVNSPDLSDAHTLIYGHNMKNSSMFGKLKYFKTKPDYFKDHRYFQIITKDKVYRYQIFAYSENEQITDGIYSVYKEPLADFYEFLDDTVCAKSQVECDLDLKHYENVVTLSTCTTAGNDHRFSVSAARVDEYNKLEEEKKEQVVETEETEETVIYITTDNVNLRSSAGMDQDIILTIPRGKSVEYLGESMEADGMNWYKVSYQNHEGYCSADYLKEKDEADEAKTTENKTYVTTAKINLRSDAGTSSDSIMKISSGETVTYLDENVEADGMTWYKVSYKNHEGYCSAEYLK